MEKEKLIELFKSINALLSGHFQLASGLHSDQYFQCALVMQNPKNSEMLGKEIAALFQGKGITCVVGPAMGGILIGYEVARALGVKSIYTERVNGQMQLRRGFEVLPSDKILIVEDVITTGGSAQEVVELLKGRTQVVGVSSIVDRSSVPPQFEVPYQSLLKMNVQTYDPADCPLCKQGKPVQKPGTKALQIQTS